MYVIISILGILFTILFVIGTHEWAHFATARLLGVKVLCFSIGFGKRLWHWYDKSGTEYIIALIPLGGYVKMLDENESIVPPAEQHLAFNRQPFYKKFLIVLAGPLCNILCALFLYWLIFVIGFTTIKPIIGDVVPDSIAAIGGLHKNQEIVSIDRTTTNSWTNIMFRLLSHLGNQDQINIGVKYNHKIENHVLDVNQWQLNPLLPDPLSSIGITPYVPEIPLVIGVISEKSPALKANLQLGDQLIALDKKPIHGWDELIKEIQDSPNKNVIFTLKRHDKTLDVPVTIGYQTNILLQKSGYLGIAPKFEWPKDMLKKVRYTPLGAISAAWQQVWDLSYFNLLLLGKMLTGKLSLQSLGGPITIFESAGDALNSGFLAYISFLAFLSITIGVINLLPIPGLDGGHLFIQIIEFITQKTIPIRILTFFYYFGFFLLMFVLVQAVTNDILRIYQ